MKETEIQAQIIEYLKTVHIFAWRNNSGMRPGASGRPVRFGAVGSPDILGALKPDGKLLAIEVKKPGEKPTPEQVLFLSNLVNSGAFVIVAECVEDVITEIAFFRNLGIIKGKERV